MARDLIAIADPASYARVMNTPGAELAVNNQTVSLLSTIAFNDALLNTLTDNLPGPIEIRRECQVVPWHRPMDDDKEFRPTSYSMRTGAVPGTGIVHNRRK